MEFPAFLLAFVFTILICLALHTSSVIAIGVLLPILYGIFYVLLEVLTAPGRERGRERAEEEQKKKRIQIEQCAEFKLDSSDYSGTLILKKRAEILANVIRIEKIQQVDVTYVPETLVYTGATVGGVTTGGFHTQGNYNKITRRGYSGKAELRWSGIRDKNDNLVSAHISYIKLNGTLLAEAKKHPTIKKFIKDDGVLSLRHDDKDIGLSSLLSPEEFGTAKFRNLANMNTIATGLTEEECKSIKEWICTDVVKK